MSPAPKTLVGVERAAFAPPETTIDHAFRIFSRGTPGEQPDMSKLESSWQRNAKTKEMSQKRSQFFDQAFAYRDLNNTAKDRVSRDYVVMAEVKLNYHVSVQLDKYT